MRHIWFGGVVILSALCALSVVLVRVIGGLESPPPALAALHLTDCQLPCWAGIIPGQTTFAEAVQRVNASNPEAVSTYPSQYTIQATYEQGYSVIPVDVIADEGGIVRQIILQTAHLNGVTLGNLLVLYGAPACMSNVPNGKVVYGAPTTFASVLAGNYGHGIWRSPLNNIEIRSYPWLTDPCADS
ncbi:MAG TPA: hypothetical protein VHD90_16215 [Phototrophicaceae bacterium]|nr:hypothetical protein [Phototrophicaceae bacterium]